MTKDAPAAREAACLCGQVRFRLTGAPLLSMACHCRGCQRMAASAFSLSTAYSIAQFELIEGAPVIGGQHGPHRQYHCPHCLAWLYTVPDGLDGIVNVRTTMLEPVPDAPPYVETYVQDALPWAKTGAMHSFPAFPPPERYPELLAGFAQWNAGV